MAIKVVFNHIIEKDINILDKNDPDWNVIMLATAYKSATPTYDLYDTPKITLDKLHSSTTLSAYIIKNSYVDKLLTLFEHCNEKWMSMQEKDKWYSFSIDLIKQREIWSTIMKNSHNHN